MASAAAAAGNGQMSEDEEEVDLVVGDDVGLLGDEDEELDFVDDGSARDEETNKFDFTVGKLEEILMDPEFEELRESFCRKNCDVFEDTEENKLVYTDVFQRYTQLVETNIEQRLKEAVPNFDMIAFLTVLDSRKEELMSDAFDLLLSIGDFDAFKEVMLSYKKEVAQGGRCGGELELTLACRGLPVHADEQVDGDARPDLDFGLTVSSTKPAGARRVATVLPAFPARRR